MIPVFVGFDPGNNRTKIRLLDKNAQIPSRIAFDCPPRAISTTTGMALKSQAFDLLFKDDQRLWFGLDTLAGGAIQKLDMAKYDADHISVLFRAALYHWGKIYKIDLSTLGKLNIVASMPPGLFQSPANNKAAKAAFQKAFNRGQSHVKIRDGKKSVQIVTHFQELAQEAVAWGQNIPRDGKTVLTVDLGGFTNDYAIFNGSPKPRLAKTDNGGLLHTYAAINPNDPAQAELRVLRTRKNGLPTELAVYYNGIENKIQLLKGRWPDPIDIIYIIGGGAALMTPAIAATFKPLADKVYIKDEFANAEANWRLAGGK